MKRLTLFLSIAAMTSLVFFGCSEEPTTPTTSNNNNGGGSAPSFYKQKVLVEYFTGAWHGYGPNGWDYWFNLNQQYGESMVTVAYHLGPSIGKYDGMESTETVNMATLLKLNNYSTAFINRIEGVDHQPVDWESYIDQALVEPQTNCGFSMDATQNNSDGTHTVAVTLGVGKEDLDKGIYRLFVMALDRSRIEPTDPDFSQENYYYEVPGHRYEGEGSPQSRFINIDGQQREISRIAGFDHMFVVKDVVTPTTGQKLETDELLAGTTHSFDYEIKAETAEDIQNTLVVAFIVEENAADSTAEVLNVQQVALGDTQDFN